MNLYDPVKIAKFRNAFQRYLDVYLTNRDLASLKEMLADDLCGYGSGLDEVCHDLQDGMRLFARDISSAPNPFKYKIRNQDIKLLDARNAIAVCELDFETIILGQIIKMNHFRMMMVLHEDAGIVKISGLHVSFPTIEHEGDESYPLKELEERNELLNRKVEEQTKKLLEKQQQLEMFFSQSLDGFFFMMLDEPVVWDEFANKDRVLDYVFAHQRVTKVNQAMLKQYGAREDQFLGLTPKDLFKHDLPQGRNIWKGLFDKGRWHMETDQRRLDGRQLWIDANYICLFDHEGRILGHFGVQRDITDKKRFDQEQKNFRKQLVQAQKMKSIGILAGGVAHDFNNLLQAMRGNIELLARNEFVDPQSARRLQIVNRSMDRAAKLVQQLMLFSRKTKPSRKRLELNQEVRETFRMLERTIPRMVTLELDLDPCLLPISGDPVQIEQLILNLTSNAVDAMPEGGTLTIETRNMELTEDEIRIHPSATVGPHVMLTVSDTGHGMDEATIEQIFDPFFTTKKTGKGTGLGMASVYGIVKAHGGFIQCSSKPGQGTAFNVFFPAAVDLKAAPVRSRAERVPKGGNETILVVDDEPEIRELNKEVLEDFGYTVYSASSGEEALDVYREHGPAIDLVLLDLNMPGMGGQKCLHELKKICRDIRVLIASGYSASGHIREILNNGAEGYISKPYRLNELKAAVRNVLDKKRTAEGPVQPASA